jgi:hypothetical protein
LVFAVVRRFVFLGGGGLARWRIAAIVAKTRPAMPGPALIVIEPELVFRGFKAVLDRPSMAFDRDQRVNRRGVPTPIGELSY